MGQRLAIATAASIVTLGIAACGEGDGGDTATTATTTPISKQQFVRDANKICSSSDDKIERASNEFFAGAPRGEGPPPEEIEQFGKKTVFPTIQAEIDRIEALGAPEGDEDEVNEILESAQAGLDELEENPERLAKGGSTTAFEEAEKLAADYGLDQCGWAPASVLVRAPH
jgi:hypothetical protein